MQLGVKFVNVLKYLFYYSFYNYNTVIFMYQIVNLFTRKRYLNSNKTLLNL